ncbi:LOW QUALITY PROTEIN: BPI fold-containing family B member 4 [Heliangelus exortis]|uniref:LOW QUALITY PROTEIN: BPI fold-containing family B member 4 n=1 Tax=Heliangelus exortis TaxID=472823 RepID=UPI003A92629A
MSGRPGVERNGLARVSTRGNKQTGPASTHSSLGRAEDTMSPTLGMALVCALLTPALGQPKDAVLRLSQSVLGDALTGSLRQGNTLQGALREVPLGSGHPGTGGTGDLLGGLGGGLIGGVLGQGGLLGDGGTLGTAGTLGGPGGLLGRGGLLDNAGLLGGGGLLSILGEGGLLSTIQGLTGGCTVCFFFHGAPLFFHSLIPVMDNLLASVLNRLLPNLLCPVVDVTLGLLSDQLGLVNFLVPLGVLGSIQYSVSSLPLVLSSPGDSRVTVVGRVAGGLVDFPLGKPEAVPMPPLSPMLDTTSSQLGLSVNFLSSVLSVLQEEGVLDMDISSGTFLELPPLTISTLGALVPLVLQAYPKTRELLLRISVPEAPMVSDLKKNKGVIQLTATEEVMVIHPDDVQSSLCLLNITSLFTSLLAQFSIEDNKLKIGVSPCKADPSLVSSSIGGFDVRARAPL